jgi:hypothetical protein
MNRKRARFAPAFSVVNAALEQRVALSGSGGALPHHAVEVAAQFLRTAPTETTVAASAGTLGQPITFTVTVRASAAAGAPQGTVALADHGTAIQTLTLAPAASPNPRFAYSTATFTLTQPPGEGAYYFGRHTITATFTPSGPFSRSIARGTLTVGEPTYTTLADGVKVATIAQGSGPEIQSGQTAGMLYTGYLAKNGQIFDDSINHGGTPFSFTLGTGQVIPGFDAGAAGMKVGETRIVEIPPAEGYGATATGSIPANSTLIFVLTLQSIS